MMTNFMEHVSQFGHSYGTVEEFNFRAGLFEATEKLINETNAENVEAGHSLRLGHNKLSTWTQAEKKRLTGFIDRGVAAHGEPTVLPPSNGDDKNWLNEGKVAEVKD